MSWDGERFPGEANAKGKWEKNKEKWQKLADSIFEATPENRDSNTEKYLMK